jgi:hypothetical protein
MAGDHALPITYPLPQVGCVGQLLAPDMPVRGLAITGRGADEAREPAIP